MLQKRGLFHDLKIKVKVKEVRPVQVTKVRAFFKMDLKLFLTLPQWKNMVKS